RVMRHLRLRKQSLTQHHLCLQTRSNNMVHKGNALNARKGWAVASLFHKAKVAAFSVRSRISRQKNFKFALANGGLLAALIIATHPSFAGSTDLLSSQDATVSGTFGHGSSLEKYFYYGEIIMAAFTYIKVRSPLVFVGLIMLLVFTRLGFSLAG
ncbi:type IV conjugative transfer system pilin TraA, partial [Cronobacter dublinensis]